MFITLTYTCRPLKGMPVNVSLLSLLFNVPVYTLLLSSLFAPSNLVPSILPSMLPSRLALDPLPSNDDSNDDDSNIDDSNDGDSNDGDSNDDDSNDDDSNDDDDDDDNNERSCIDIIDIIVPGLTAPSFFPKGLILLTIPPISERTP